MPDVTKGIYNKYIVRRIDGKRGHDNCQYFVLDVSHDKYAIPALEAYIKALPESFELLKNDLRKIIRGSEFNPVTEKMDEADEH